MENDAKKIVWTIGAQMMALAIILIFVALIVWIASKAWKKGQVESSYDARGGNWLGY
jgi:hypothetical protein